MKKTKQLKNSRGITLIVLVITVIIMIILAGVVLNYALGEGGLIGRAEDASNRYQKAEEGEIAYLNRVDQKYDSILNRIEGGDMEENPSPSPSDNPNPTTSPSPTTPITGGTVEDSKGDKFENTTTITDGNGEEVTVPGGFTVSPDSSDDVNGGIVIVDEQGNEFVWVPVPDPTTMYVEETVTLSGVDVTSKRYSKLRNDTTFLQKKPGSETGSKEPDVLSHTEYGDINGTDTSRGITQIKNVLGIEGGRNEEILRNYAISLVDEYNAMIDSVIKYKGFYIARYELTGTADNPTSKAGAVYANQNWYIFKKACTNMISNAYAQSTMIYGCQWDETIDWLVRSGAKSSAEVYSNSTSWGNYGGNSGTKKETGSSENYKVNNIYDLFGNYIEWTQEGCDTAIRVPRGGCYSGLNNVAIRAITKVYIGGATYDSIGKPYKSGSYSWLSTRAALYVK